MSLKITNGLETIELEEKYCLKLEYEVNKFGRKDNWVSIGNHLYYFVCPDSLHPKSRDTLIVEEKYFSVIKNIIQSNKFV